MPKNVSASRTYHTAIAKEEGTDAVAGVWGMRGALILDAEGHIGIQAHPANNSAPPALRAAEFAKKIQRHAFKSQWVESVSEIEIRGTTEKDNEVQSGHMLSSYYSSQELGKTSAQVALGVRDMGMGSGGKRCGRGRWHGKGSFVGAEWRGRCIDGWECEGSVEKKGNHVRVLGTRFELSHEDCYLSWSSWRVVVVDI
ncbi:hypothetical protein V8E52_002063 [Russula decolorans]